MTQVSMSASQRRRRAHKGHRPARVGGQLGVSIHCQCGWHTGRHLTAMSAWAAFSAHEKQLDQEKTA